MEFRCPYCHSPIYSRKNKICGVCEKPLPKELLFSDQQVADLKRQMEQEEKWAKAFNPEIQHDSPGTGSFGII
jgi:predicted amidophosphoribosyltransferase